MRRVETTVGVDHGQFWMYDTNAEPEDDGLNGAVANGLVGVSSDGRHATVLTGTGWGSVPAVFEVHHQEPAPAFDGWEEVVDVSMLLPDWGPIIESPTSGAECGFRLVEDAEPPGELDELDEEEWEEANLALCRWWRLRVHAAGRDSARDQAGPDDPDPEHLLVQAWPAPRTAATVHRLTDKHGARRRTP